jgi:hypothetical protein
MGEDYNINIRNGMGGGGKSAAQQKISGKGSIAKAKNTINHSGLVRKSLGTIGKGISMATGSGGSGALASSIGKSGGVAGQIAGFLITNAEKIANFGINIYEAGTGNEMASHNYRTTLKTISSMGKNYLIGAIQNELFTKQTISRQNYGMDYGRELYQINVDGFKNKRI